jgi:hypothetical protein
MKRIFIFGQQTSTVVQIPFSRGYKTVATIRQRSSAYKITTGGSKNE